MSVPRPSYGWAEAMSSTIGPDKRRRLRRCAIQLQLPEDWRSGGSYYYLWVYP